MAVPPRLAVQYAVKTGREASIKTIKEGSEKALPRLCRSFRASSRVTSHCFCDDQTCLNHPV